MNYDYFPELLDSSMLAQFKDCPFLFYESQVENFKPKRTNVHLHAGGAYAKGLEYTRRSFYERDMSADDSIALGLQALLAQYGDFECPPESGKSAARVARAFEYYWEQYALSHVDAYPILLPGNKRAIEFTFSHPLPVLNPLTDQPILYGGRMDAIINYGGSIMVCDEKTTAQLGPSWPYQWDLRSQIIGYIWGCRQSGIHVDGALIRGIAIKKRDYDTQQKPMSPSDWLIAQWYEELIGWVEEIVKCWKTQKWRHAYDHACTQFGGCQFQEVCKWENSETELRASFERRIWHPLARVERVIDEK